jgi:FAD dependent oxidoreductase
VVIHAAQVLDATDEGDLLPLTGWEHVLGAESAEETGEPHALHGPQTGNDPAYHASHRRRLIARSWPGGSAGSVRRTCRTFRIAAPFSEVCQTGMESSVTSRERTAVAIWGG